VRVRPLLIGPKPQRTPVPESVGYREDGNRKVG